MNTDGVLGEAIEVLEIASLGTLREQDGPRAPFTRGEWDYAFARSDPERRLAARLAAKRAAACALGGGLAPEDVEVVRAPGGPPRLRLSERAGARLRALGGARVLVSLTHGRTHAAASVLVVRDAS